MSEYAERVKMTNDQRLRGMHKITKAKPTEPEGARQKGREYA